MFLQELTFPLTWIVMLTPRLTATDRILVAVVLVHIHKVACSPRVGMKRHSVDFLWSGIFFVVRPRHCLPLGILILTWCHLTHSASVPPHSTFSLSAVVCPLHLFLPNLLPGLLSCMDVSDSRRERRASPSVAGCQAGVSLLGASRKVGGASSPRAPSNISVQRKKIVFGFRIALPQPNVFSANPHDCRFHVIYFVTKTAARFYCFCRGCRLAASASTPLFTSRLVSSCPWLETD